MMNFRRTFRLALLLTSGLVLANCGNDSTNNTAFRLIQASPDLPPINFVVDGVILRGAVEYKGGTGFLTVTPQSYEFAVETIIPSLDGPLVSVQVTPTVSLPLAVGHEYTFIAIGKEATNTVQPLIIDNLTEEVPQGNARLQFLHAAPDVPEMMDIYLTAVPELPELLPDVSTQTPIAQVTYGQQPAARQVVPTGRYVIRVTRAGLTDVLFDSGEIPLSNGNDFLIVAVDNSAAGSSPISLAFNSGFRTYYNPVGTFDILDKDSPSDVRVVHLSPDSPALDVVGDPDTTTSLEKTFASGLTYLNYTDYVPTIPDTYTVRGVKTSEPNPTTPLFSFTRALGYGQRSTVYITGLLASINPVVAPDEIRPVHAYGKLRILDASPSSATVDVYILATGTDIATVAPSLSGLVLGSATPYLPVFPRNYTVTFTEAGTKTVLATKEVAATQGTVQTAILVDAVRVDETSTGKPPAVLLMDDLSS